MTCRESDPLAVRSGSDLHWLQTCDAPSLALHNRLHRLRSDLQGQVGERSIGIRWGAVVDAAQHVEPAWDVHVALADTVLTLRLPHAALEALQLGGLASAELQGPAGLMLVESALLSLVQPIETLTGHALEVIDAQAADARFAASNAGELGMTLLVQVTGFEAWAVPVRMTAGAARLIADLLDTHATPAWHSLANIRLPFAVHGAQADLSLGELRSLRSGDVVMLDDWPDTHVRLVLDNRLHVRATRDGQTLTLLEQPIAVNLIKEHRMTESAVGTSLEGALDATLDSTLDALPLTLVCQVGSVEMSLAQLRELGAGSVVQLDAQQDDRVDLMVNGRRVGQGQLVKIGDGLGVRLLSFATA